MFADKYPSIFSSQIEVIVYIYKHESCLVSFKKMQIIYRKEISESRGSLMVSAFVFGSSDPGSSPGRGHCVAFLGKTLYSHSASLQPGI